MGCQVTAAALEEAAAIAFPATLPSAVRGEACGKHHGAEVGIMSEDEAEVWERSPKYSPASSSSPNLDMALPKDFHSKENNLPDYVLESSPYKGVKLQQNGTPPT